MAEAVVSNIAESIMKSLGSFALQKIGLLWDFKDELEKLGNEVTIIQAVLSDAEVQQDHNPGVKAWLRKLKDALIEADDLLDGYSAELLRRQVMTRNKRAKQVRIFCSKSNKLAYGFKMGPRVKKVRKTLDDIAAYRSKFVFTEGPTGIQFEHRRREDTHSFVREEEVIGREDAKKDVKELLLDSDGKKDVSIIPIVGIGGLGKTTLAQHVYNDEEVKKHFDLRLWVCVSDPFDVKTIVQKILKCNGFENLEMDSLQSRLRERIGGRRYLLVLDDVWNENRDTWLSLRTLLLDGKEGSKVLITTRSKKVAKCTGTAPYLLGGLSESDSWDLFKSKAFEEGKELNPRLEEIGRDIVQKCARVPLAIRSIGSLLYFKNSEDDWLHFKDTELYNITQLDDTTQQDNAIFPILKLSYDHLSLRLKQCFAFCSLFPKDSEIDVKLLIKLWIAQGFIHSSDGNRSLEDVGHECFENLLWRSFFQDIQRDNNGDIYCCKMHDLIHDLAELVAGEECTNSNPNAETVVKRTRHVAFHSLYSLPDIPARLLKAYRIRTLLVRIPNSFRFILGPISEGNKKFKNYGTLISSFKCLRALNLSYSNIQKVPNSIGKLKHLRYLDLSSNERIKLLPASITKLQNLQTLRLDACLKLKELPEDTRNLISLRHLMLSECCSLTHMPRGLGVLTALQTLTQYTLGKNERFFPNRKGGLDELDKLDELRGELLIKGLEHLRSSPLEAKAAYLDRKQHLKILRLNWDPKSGDDSGKAIANDEPLLENLRPHQNLKDLRIYGYAGVGLSSWVSSLSNLVSFTLWDCKWCQDIPSLDRFPSLEVLHLQKLSALEYMSNDGNDVSASSLRYLLLTDLPKLRRWSRMRETVTAELTSLQTLEILKCPNLLSLPDGMRRLTTLRCSRIEECPHLEERCEQGTGED